MQTSITASGPSKFFLCNQCLRIAPRSTPSRVLNAVRSRPYADAAVNKSIGSIAEQAPVRGASSISQAAKKAWPESNPKGVGLWLIGSAVSVFGIVVFGGLTRLTESGYVNSLSCDN